MVVGVVTPKETGRVRAGAVVVGAVGTVPAANAGSTVNIFVVVQPYNGGGIPEVAAPKISMWNLKTGFTYTWVDTLPVNDNNLFPGVHAWQTSYVFSGGGVGGQTGLYTVLASVTSTSGKQIVKPIGMYYYGP